MLILGRFLVTSTSSHCRLLNSSVVRVVCQKINSIFGILINEDYPFWLPFKYRANITEQWVLFRLSSVFCEHLSLGTSLVYLPTINFLEMRLGESEAAASRSWERTTDHTCFGRNRRKHCNIAWKNPVSSTGTVAITECLRHKISHWFPVGSVEPTVPASIINHCRTVPISSLPELQCVEVQLEYCCHQFQDGSRDRSGMFKLSSHCYCSGKSTSDIR